MLSPASSVLAAWLRLHLTPSIGAASLQKCMAAFGGPQATLQASRPQLIQAGLSARQADRIIQHDPQAQVEQALTWQDEPGQTIIYPGHPHYPAHLLDIHQPPAVLYVRGQVETLAEPQLAVVGSRNATRGAQETATQFAHHLSQQGLVITSGLALGIDTCAHEGALNSSLGATVAVIATGADRVYPARNKTLAERILSQGAIVSEFPLGTQPRPEYFPQRNRIITGLSLGTLVVEAGLKSGSLISARHAMEQGREVYAIPGSIHNPLARGCHRLIRDGAKLVETAQDILEELAPQLSQVTVIDSVPANAETALDADQTALLQAMGFDPIGLDQIIQVSGLNAQAASSMLLILELEGYLHKEPGGLYQRIR